MGTQPAVGRGAPHRRQPARDPAVRRRLLLAQNAASSGWSPGSRSETTPALGVAAVMPVAAVRAPHTAGWVVHPATPLPAGHVLVMLQREGTRGRDEIEEFVLVRVRIRHVLRGHAMPANQTPTESLRRIDRSDVPPLPPGRSVTLPGRGTMFVRDTGGPAEAPVVMLLHGLGATASLNSFTAFPALERRHRVVAPDHRGHGRGIRSDASFTLEDAADDVVALADTLRVERFVVVGYSMGGPIAQLVWRRHPERIAGLVMCTTSYRFRESAARRTRCFAALPALEHIQRMLPDSAARHVVAQISRSYFADTGYSEWAQREVMRRDPRAVLQAAMALGRYSAAEWVGEIDVPTAVLVHTRDQVVPPRRQFELASGVVGAVTHFVGSDHFAVVRHPQRFVRALVNAIDDVTYAHPTANAFRQAS